MMKCVIQRKCEDVLETLISVSPNTVGVRGYQLSTCVKQMARARSIGFGRLVSVVTARGADIFALSLGEAFFGVPWLGVRGLAALREKIAQFYRESTDRFVRVLIGTESEERIANALRTMRDSIGEFDRGQSSAAQAGVLLVP